MNRRNMCMALGCLALSLAVVSPAEAGGRPRPPKPTGTRVTVINKTGKNLLTMIYNPPPFPATVGQAKAVGARVVNAGATTVFTNVKAGKNLMDVIDVAVLSAPITDATSLIIPNLGDDQIKSDDVTAAANKNTIVEVSLVNNALQYTVK